MKNLLFTSRKERLLWLSAFLVSAIIFSTLFLGQPLSNWFQSQDIQAIYFLIGMFMTAIVIIMHAFFSRITKIELVTLLGIITIYFMLLLRLGLAERSHLIEYSVLAIIIHKAFITRKNNKKLNYNSAKLGIITTFLISILDEALQLFIPNRVFDYYDILFNAIVIVAAIGFYVLVQWIKLKANSM